MTGKIEIDGWMCDVIETGYKYENLVPVRKGNLTGCWHRKQKCLVDGWHERGSERKAKIKLSGGNLW